MPCYKVAEAAKYARTTPATVGRWHKGAARSSMVLSDRTPRSELSYMQLIEVAVVAAMREIGLPLRKIREARGYYAQNFMSEFPFAEYKFKSDGAELWTDYDQIVGASGKGKMLAANRRGQLCWSVILDHRLKEFEYEDSGAAIKWNVGGAESKIIIDPRVSFGAPSVSGIPTWAIRGRWSAGEDIQDIADDFEISDDLVRDALIFENINPNGTDSQSWAG